MKGDTEEETKKVKKLEIPLHKNVLKQVDVRSLMEMDKAFEQLKTQVFDLCHGGNSSSSYESVFTEFEAKYRTFKGLFLASRDNEKRRESVIFLHAREVWKRMRKKKK
ncbi:hypothetical protein CK203_033787 [Vitis vinifera]|uniref:Uncharacterized protein n=1 Tax=Vitis vinifera TaxID=29760 RepID=A0A438IQC2_VITVI|nr:hypothetical protein CK203_033787 [Vitis vinifera]